MACEVLQLSGWIDSDHLLDTTGTDHVAGQPAMLTAAGKMVLADNPDDIVGFFKSDMVDEQAAGFSAADATVSSSTSAGVVMGGPNKIKLSIGRLKDGTTQLPFVYPGTHTWAAKNHVFLGSGSKLDNAPANANDQPIGTVTKAPTDDDQTLEFVSVALPAPFHATVTT